MSEASANPGDVDPTEPDASDAPFVRPIDRFARSAAGSAVAAGLLGLRNALEGRPDHERPVITTEAPAAKPPERFELVLDPDHPERAVVIVRAADEHTDE